MADTKLKPCPFCGKYGKRSIIGHNFLNEYRVEHICRDFSVLGRKWHKSEEKAISEWNSRAYPEKQEAAKPAMEVGA